MKILTLLGVLDSSTYLHLRDAIITAALEEPAAVIVDLSALEVPAPSALAVFTSAQWHVDRWPVIPILLVCSDDEGRRTLEHNGVARYMGVYPSVPAALDALKDHTGHHRRRARAVLPQDLTSLRRARDLVEEWLTAWSQQELIAVTKVVVTAFVENALQHTADPPTVRLETDGSVVTVAVEDCSHAPAAVRDDLSWRHVPTGLQIVAALCRSWGNAPTPSGKTVWATVGPENRL